MRLCILSLLLLSLSAQAQLPSPKQADSLVTQASGYSDAYADTLVQTVAQFKHHPDSVVSAYASAVDSIAQLPVDRTQALITNRQKQLTSLIDSLPLPDELSTRMTSLAERSASGQLGYLKSQLPVEKLPTSLPASFPTVHAVRDRISQGQAQWEKYRQQLDGFTDKLTELPTTAEQQLIRRTPLADLPPPDQAFRQQPQAYQNQLASLSNTELMRSRLQQELVSRAQNHAADHWPEAMKKIASLKKKVTGPPGGQEVLPKKNPLSGKPLGERLVYGGSVQTLQGPPLTLQLAPQLGYQISKRWLAGLSGQYQLKLRTDRKGIDTKTPVYGGSAFSHYQFFRGFLVHTEAELMSQMTSSGNDLLRRNWQANWLVGVGKTYPLAGQWRGKVVLLYNFSYQKQSLYPKPWIVRFSFYRKK